MHLHNRPHRYAEVVITTMIIVHTFIIGVPFITTWLIFSAAVLFVLHMAFERTYTLHIIRI